MKKISVTIKTTKKIKVTEGKKFVEFDMDENHKCTELRSNMPYEKSNEDWKFFAKAINKMLKELAS